MRVMENVIIVIGQYFRTHTINKKRDSALSSVRVCWPHSNVMPGFKSDMNLRNGVINFLCGEKNEYEMFKIKKKCLHTFPLVV